MMHTGVHNEASRACKYIPAPLARKVLVAAVHGHVSNKIYLRMQSSCSLRVLHLRLPHMGAQGMEQMGRHHVGNTG